VTVEGSVARVVDELEGFPDPDPSLEQYETPGEIVLAMLNVADSEVGIEGARVLDLGAGTGRIGIGAALAGATHVTCVEVDPEAAEVLKRNAERVGVDDRIEVIVEDVSGWDPEPDGYDVTVMNPPFGCRRRGADRPFVEKALRASPLVVSLHRAGTEGFWRRRARDLGATCEVVGMVRFPIKASFGFHRKPVEFVDAVVLKFERG